MISYFNSSIAKFKKKNINKPESDELPDESDEDESDDEDSSFFFFFRSVDPTRI